MSQIYAPTRQGRIAMFREARENALRRGDMGMVRGMDAELAALGLVPEGEFETVTEDPLETAVPKKRGRRPKPRCEHGRIEERCLDCNEELAAQWPEP